MKRTDYDFGATLADWHDQKKRGMFPNWKEAAKGLGLLLVLFAIYFTLFVLFPTAVEALK